MTGRPRLLAALGIAAGLFAGCSAPGLVGGPVGGPSGGANAGVVVSSRVLPALAGAEARATDLGPVPGGMTVRIELTLRGRDGARLARLLGEGGRVGPDRWASTYGPSPPAVARLERALRRAGLSARWSAGDPVLAAAGPAGAVERLFDARIRRFDLAGGVLFYAPLGPLRVPPSMAFEVLGAAGADDYRNGQLAADPSANGVTPGEISRFYDLTPLRNAGLDGSGVTVVFPEWAMPAASVLGAYAARFGLPAFDVTVHDIFGAPGGPTSAAAGETALDLEVVHGLAPGAREIVYEIGDPTRLAEAIQVIVGANPGAIVSSSISNGEFDCEAAPGARAYALAVNAVFARAAAEGTSIFWAAGDRGAYACLPSGVSSLEQDISVEPEAASPNITTVGGTAVFLASNGAYYKEAAWGEPLEQWGGGGGISTVFPQPSYQVAPGVGPHSLTGRGLPDVAADADPTVSGWDIYMPPAKGQSGAQQGPVGGTSAAAPCWAAITALIDEDLHRQGLAAVGFANPALYLFARRPAGLPAPAFHEVTEGSNLHYLASAGWNPATGLGTPDVGHLAEDFEWYERSRQHSG